MSSSRINLLTSSGFEVSISQSSVPNLNSKYLLILNLTRGFYTSVSISEFELSLSRNRRHV